MSITLAESGAEDGNPADDDHKNAAKKTGEEGAFDESHYPDSEHSSCFRWYSRSPGFCHLYVGINLIRGVAAASRQKRRGIAVQVDACIWVVLQTCRGRGGRNTVLSANLYG